jgi:hypothetical protein
MSSERYLRCFLVVLTVVAAALLLCHGAVMLWAEHQLNGYEAVIVLHLARFASEGELYFELNRYPYTVATYPPVYYLLGAGICKLGVPPLLAGRVVSFAALVGLVVLAWKLLRLYMVDLCAAWVGTLLAGSLANLAFWGTVCRVDALAVFFAVWAFYHYSKYHFHRRTAHLAAALGLAVVAAFTKQTMLVVGGVIVLLLALQDWRRAARVALAWGGCTLAVALALNQLTAGRFFANTLRTNVNAFEIQVFWWQVRYFVLAGMGLAAIAAPGLIRRDVGRLNPVPIYTMAAVAVFFLTCGKYGADRNYQIEALFLAALCAALSLDRLHFFPSLLRANRTAVTMLQIPLMFQLAVNFGENGKLLRERWVQELQRRSQYAILRPFLQASPDPILAANQDPLLRAGRRLAIEPLNYSILVGQGTVDPEPVRRDLAAGRFPLILLHVDLSSERPDLPELQAIQNHYKLMRHIPGPEDYYLYVPR